MRILILSTLAVATTLSAGMAAASSGLDQLAASAGVSANDFTAAQLIQLRDAQRDNDQERISFILSQAGTGTVTRSDMGSSEISQNAQLAASAGVAPGLYTTGELQVLIEAKRDNDIERARFILSGENRKGASPTSAVSPGKAQLAAALGLNAADYSLAELARLHAEQIDSDFNRS